MTGLKEIQMGDETVNRLLTEIRGLPQENVEAIFYQGQDPNPKPKPSLMPEETKIVMINSDFDMGFRINREVLHR